MTKSTHYAQFVVALVSCITIAAPCLAEAQVRPYQHDSGKSESPYVTQPPNRSATDQPSAPANTNRMYASSHGLGNLHWVSIFELSGLTGEVREAIASELLFSHLSFVSADPIVSPAGQRISGWHYKATYGGIGDIFFFFAENPDAFDPTDYKILWSFDDSHWEPHSHGFLASLSISVAEVGADHTVEGRVSGLDVQRQNNGIVAYAFIGDTTAGVQVLTRDPRFQSALEQASGNTDAIPQKKPRVEVTYSVVNGLNQVKRITFLDR